MNEQIRITPIRLIGFEGEQHGIVPTQQALEMAREIGLDLVEVAPTERPPVCKIMDLGKHKYSQSKKQHQKTHQQKLKELRVRPKTGDHDVDTRVNQAKKFLEHGDKVILKVQFRGREMQHIEEGRRIIDAMLEKLLEFCKVEKAPSMEGKQMTAPLAKSLRTTLSVLEITTIISRSTRPIRRLRFRTRFSRVPVGIGELSGAVLRHTPCIPQHGGAFVPKLNKTNKSMKKRFRVTGTGKLKHGKCGKRHLNAHFTGKRRRQLRQAGLTIGPQVKKYLIAMNEQ